MELCIKTDSISFAREQVEVVSILVLMELCIKTVAKDCLLEGFISRFNPCFNGTMYKNIGSVQESHSGRGSFNPCFNGTMYKNGDIFRGFYLFNLFQSLF